jgi:hypothetical protein
MPEKRTVRRAKSALRQGKKPSTAAGEFVREEVHHVRSGKHGARSAEQAVAIGLAKARRAGVPLAPPKSGRTKQSTRKAAERDYEVGQGRRKRPSPSAKRSRAASRALGREGRSSARRSELSRHARAAAGRRKKRGRAGA